MSDAFFSSSSSVSVGDESHVTLRPIRYQVSGHTPILHRIECPSHSYKPYNTTEHSFYTTVYSDESLRLLRAVIPKFYGVQSVDVSNVGLDSSQHMLHFSKQSPKDSDSLTKKMTLCDDGRAKFLVLECVGCGLDHPSIADFKLGLAEEANAKMKTLDHSMASFSAEKLQWKATKAQLTTSASLACRMCGMLVWNAVAKAHVFHDKYSAFNQTEDNHDEEAEKKKLQESISEFFSDGTGGLRIEVMKEVLRRLDEIHRIVSDISTCPFLLWSASLFIAFDGDYSDGDDISLHVFVKLLDFGRVIHLNSDELRSLFGQDGVASGLSSLQEALSSLLKDH